MGSKECNICGKKITLLTSHFKFNTTGEIVCSDCIKSLGYNLGPILTKPLVLSNVLSALSIEKLKSGEAHQIIDSALLNVSNDKIIKKQDKKLAKAGVICSKCHSHNVTSLGGIQKGNFGIIKVGSTTKAFKMMCNDCGNKWEIKN